MFDQRIDGKQVSEHNLPSLMALNQGHFTVMQVREGKVQGLNLHFDRLFTGSRLLFGCDIGRDLLYEAVKTATDRSITSTLRVNVFSTTQMPSNVSSSTLHIVTTQTAPLYPVPNAISVCSVTYCRFLPQVKHSGIAPAAFYHRREAALSGFDDVVYTDKDGWISEGSVWNICFLKNREFVFPNSPALNGIRLQLVLKGLETHQHPYIVRPVNLRELPSFQAAFLLNSINFGQPILKINEVVFEDSAPGTLVLRDIYKNTVWQQPNFRL